MRKIDPHPCPVGLGPAVSKINEFENGKQKEVGACAHIQSGRRLGLRIRSKWLMDLAWSLPIV